MTQNWQQQEKKENGRGMRLIYDDVDRDRAFEVNL